MNKSAKTLIIVIGVVSILAGIYSLSSGAAFMSYFPGIFIGVTLIGSAFLFPKDKA